MKKLVKLAVAVVAVAGMGSAMAAHSSGYSDTAVKVIPGGTSQQKVHKTVKGATVFSCYLTGYLTKVVSGAAAIGLEGLSVSPKTIDSKTTIVSWNLNPPVKSVTVQVQATQDFKLNMNKPYYVYCSGSANS